MALATNDVNMILGENHLRCQYQRHTYIIFIISSKAAVVATMSLLLDINFGQISIRKRKEITTARATINKHLKKLHKI